ncbi:MAG: metallophosphoesterase family protein [Chloroflexota bacterium]
MKIAVLTDVHSNFHSLSAVLEDLTREKPDRIVGAGDMVGCSAYAGAAAVWQALHEAQVPLVLGNEEARILDYHSPAPHNHWKHSIQFRPLQYRATQFAPGDIEAMRRLPVSILLDGPGGQDVLVCHASPGDLHHSPMQGIDSRMEKALEEAPARVIVVGHYHRQWQQAWREKLLVMAGSAGLPLRGRLDEVDYLVLTFRNGAWHFRYKTVQYDHQAALRAAIESPFLEQAGPIGWLMFAEILTQEDHLTPFLSDYCPEHRPDNLESWAKLARGYLAQVDHWQMVEPYLQPLL